MFELNELILSFVSQYGVLTLALAMLISAVGLPIPATPLILAAGTLARQELVAVPAAPILILVGVTLGDLVSYSIGRFAGGWMGGGSGRRARLMDVARERFSRHGALALFFTRSILVSLDVPTNLAAGSSRYPITRFLTVSLLGRTVWVALYFTIGYLFSDRWVQISQVLAAYSTKIGVIAGVCVALFFLYRYITRPRLIRNS